jgi:hypothetical protein
MCMHVYGDWQGCKHTQFIGFQHCGLNTKIAEHYYVSNYFQESGFDCELCLAKDDKAIDPDDVKYYPPSVGIFISGNCNYNDPQTHGTFADSNLHPQNLNVTTITDWRGVKTVISRPQHCRNWNSLSDAGSEGSCSSIAARMCGISLSHKDPKGTSQEKISAERPANAETLTTTVNGDEVSPSTERRASHDGQVTFNGEGAPIPDIEVSIENNIRSREQVELQRHRALLEEQLKNLPQLLTHTMHQSQLTGVDQHRALLESQLKNLQHRISHMEQPKLTPTHWVQAPVFRPGKVSTSPACLPQTYLFEAVPLVRVPQTTYMSSTPMLPPYMSGMSQPQMNIVIPVPVSEGPPPTLQMNNNSSTASIHTMIPSNTDTQAPTEPTLRPVASLSAVPQVTPSPRPPSFQPPRGPSRTQSQVRSVNRTSIRSNLAPGGILLSGGTDQYTQLTNSMPVRRLSLADLIVRFAGKGTRRKEPREVESGAAKESECEMLEKEREVEDAGDKGESVDEM